MARKTKQEALETRNRLLDAAEQLFHDRGVSRTSLQDIAAAAGVTRGAVYWHFQDKAELFNAMMDRATMPFEEGMGLGETQPQERSLQALRWGMMNVFHSTMHNARTRRVFEIAMQKVEYTGELQALKDRKLDIIRDWREENRAVFDTAVAQGLLPRELNTEIAAIALMALVDGLLHQWILAPDSFDLMHVGRSAVEGFLSSLAQTWQPLLPEMSAQELARLGQQPICQG
jgi:TetR/AcrR family acrAB operon transcriptional repressor